MPAISSLTRPKPITATFGDGDETVTFRFDRNAVTLNFAERIQELDGPEALAEAVAVLILDWDVTKDDGTAFPPTRENLGTLPLSTLMAIAEAIKVAAVPSSEEGKDSPEPSSTPPSDSKAQPPTLQNGQGTSGSPVFSVSQSSS